MSAQLGRKTLDLQAESALRNVSGIVRISGGDLVLLRQKFERLYFVIRARQQGHRGKLAMRASINRRRMVAIEFGM